MKADITSSRTESARLEVKKEIVFTLKRLVSIFECSSRTAQTKLKLWGTFTSYNQNGKYYTLPEIPQFDEYGLWKYGKAAFSKHGNLKKTVVHLVTTASAGLSGKQLGNILGLPPRSFLHHFRQCLGIRREKYDGVYVYFGDDQSTYTKQVEQRQSPLFTSSIIKLSDAEAIMILVAVIKHHGIFLHQI